MFHDVSQLPVGLDGIFLNPYPPDLHKGTHQQVDAIGFKVPSRAACTTVSERLGGTCGKRVSSRDSPAEVVLLAVGHGKPLGATRIDRTDYKY